MTRDGGISPRYTAYSLAFELGYADVDAMLEGITALQYQEWLAFFKIRREGETRAQGSYGDSREEQQRLSGDILRAMSGYQQRRDNRKA